MRTILLLLTLCGLEIAARAETVGVVVTGEATMQPQLVNQLETWLTKHGHQLVAAPLPADAVNTLVDCFVIEDEGCARGVIEKRAKSAIVYARVDIQAGGDLEKTVTVLAYWFAKGQPAVAERRFCQRCSESTLRNTTDELMQALSKAGRKKAGGTIKLTSFPAGALVAIDGRSVGSTPLDHDADAGSHEITISHDGRDTETRVVQVKAGEIATVDVPLVVVGTRKRRPVLPIATMAAGGAMLVTGAILLAINPDDSPNRPEFIYETARWGVALGISGIAVAAAGYVWFHSVSKRSSTPVAAISGSGGYVGWITRF